MSKCYKYKKYRKKFGFIVVGLGIGIILVFVIPVWGWILAVAAGLIYIGWYLINHSHR